MSKTVAKIISWVLHPVFMPILSFIIIYYSFPYHYSMIPSKKWNISIIVILLMTTIFPAIMTLVLKKLKIVDDIDISVQKQRIFPYMIFFFFYLLSFLTFKPKEVSSLVFMEDPLFATLLLGATISIGISFFLNNFLKVSIHTTAITSLFSFCCMLVANTNKNLFFIIMALIIGIGLIGASRIVLKAHTTREVYYGIFSGILGQVLAFTLYFRPFINQH